MFSFLCLQEFQFYYKTSHHKKKKQIYSNMKKKNSRFICYLLYWFYHYLDRYVTFLIHDCYSLGAGSCGDLIKVIAHHWLHRVRTQAGWQKVCP